MYLIALLLKRNRYIKICNRIKSTSIGTFAKVIEMNEEKPTTSGRKSVSMEKDIDSEDSNRGSEEHEEEGTFEIIRRFFKQKLTLTSTMEEADGSSKVIDDLTLVGLTKHWKTKGFKNVITMVGAGISTSAGIPDFRSPGSGLYDNLKKYNLPYPSAIFEMDYFLDNPQPFFALAKELYPGTFEPTPCHYFVRLLHEKGLLVRHYTQNIDTLERIAGIPSEKLVEAHGTFYTNHCLGCRKAYSMEWMKEQIFADNVPTCSVCNDVVKPDIVFFGENLPEKFYTSPREDFAKCDLLIIMGTSLEVQPFASLVQYAEANCVRLLINRVKVGQDAGLFNAWFMSGPGLLYDTANNKRDVAFIGDCDDGVMTLVDALGWGEELRDLIKNEHTRLLTQKTEKQTDVEIPKTVEKESKGEPNTQTSITIRTAINETDNDDSLTLKEVEQKLEHINISETSKTSPSTKKDLTSQ